MAEYNISGIDMTHTGQVSTSTTVYVSTTALVPRIPAVDALCFLIIISCFIVGSVGNAIALRYFLTKKRDIPTSIYIFIAIVDILVSVLILPAGLPYLGQKSSDEKRGWIFEKEVLCNLWGVMWYVFSIATIFLVAMLSITRTIHLVAPFRNLNKRAVIGVIVGYLVFLSVQSTLPLWVGESYVYYYRNPGYCFWNSGHVLTVNSIESHIYTQLVFFEYYFPIFPIIISCCLTIRSLKTSENRALNDANLSVTKTILLFTALYLLCNLPPVMMYLMSILESKFNVAIDTSWDSKYHYFFKFYSLFSVSINSALNPVLYLCRMRQLRRSTVAMIRQGVEVVSVKLGGSSTSSLMNNKNISVTAVTRV